MLDAGLARCYNGDMEYERSEHLYTRAQGYITTISGRDFNPMSHAPDFCINDIAHALGMNCRFNGHCAEFYSVAEHSVLVAAMMETFREGDPFEGLMHDGTEAYLSDIPAPFKQYFPDLVRHDKQLDAKLRLAFDLPLVSSKECKKFDWLALFIEAYWLLPGKGENFYDPYNLRYTAMCLKDEFRPVPMLPCEARAVFHDKYTKLTESRHNLPYLSELAPKHAPNPHKYCENSGFVA